MAYIIDQNVGYLVKRIVEQAMESSKKKVMEEAKQLIEKRLLEECLNVKINLESNLMTQGHDVTITLVVSDLQTEKAAWVAGETSSPSPKSSSTVPPTKEI